jgi:hypothetical protein
LYYLSRHRYYELKQCNDSLTFIIKNCKGSEERMSFFFTKMHLTLMELLRKKWSAQVLVGCLGYQLARTPTSKHLALGLPCPYAESDLGLHLSWMWARPTSSREDTWYLGCLFLCWVRPEHHFVLGVACPYCDREPSPRLHLGTAWGQLALRLQ